MPDQTQPVTRIALIGFGTVGASVAKLLATLLPSRPSPHPHLQPQRLPASREVKPRRRPRPVRTLSGPRTPKTSSPPDVDVIVELIGGLDPAGPVDRPVPSPQANPSSPLTSSSSPTSGPYSPQASPHKHNVQLLHNAAVAGGVPVIPGILQGLGGDQITRISGILNGTCNFILSKMEAGRTLRRSPRRSPAPRLCGSRPHRRRRRLRRPRQALHPRPHRHARRARPRSRSPPSPSPEIDAVDFAYAKELGCTIRQVSRAQASRDHRRQRTAGRLRPRRPHARPPCQPHRLVPRHPKHGRLHRPLSAETSSSPAMAQAAKPPPSPSSQTSSPSPRTPAASTLPVTPRPVTGDSIAPHYLRFIVDDKPGIVSSIAGALSKPSEPTLTPSSSAPATPNTASPSSSPPSPASPAPSPRPSPAWEHWTAC